MKILVKFIKIIFMLCGLALYIYPLYLLVFNNMEFDINGIKILGIYWFFGYLSIGLGNSLKEKEKPFIPDRNK